MCPWKEGVSKIASGKGQEKTEVIVKIPHMSASVPCEVCLLYH